jgi:hypothetical protein
LDDPTLPGAIQSVTESIKAGQPVCARVEFSPVHGHAVIIKGYDDSDPNNIQLTISDPLWDIREPVSLDQFLTKYVNSGSWSDTYFTQQKVKEMPLEFAEPSPTVLEALHGGLARLPGGGVPLVKPNTPFLADIKAKEALQKGQSQPSFPHPIYSMDVTQLTQGVGLETAKPVGWAFFINSVSSSAIAAEVDSGATDCFAGSVRGPLTESTLAAIQDASRDPKVVNGSYELRLLRIPALSFATVWLADKSGTDDIFIPLKGVSRGLDPTKRYAREQVAAELRRYANNQMEDSGHKEPVKAEAVQPSLKD